MGVLPIPPPYVPLGPWSRPDSFVPWPVSYSTHVPVPCVSNRSVSFVEIVSTRNPTGPMMMMREMRVMQMLLRMSGTWRPPLPSCWDLEVT